MSILWVPQKPRQTGQTQIRLLPQKRSDQDLLCLLFWRVFCEFQPWWPTLYLRTEREIFSNFLEHLLYLIFSPSFSYLFLLESLLLPWLSVGDLWRHQESGVLRFTTLATTATATLTLLLHLFTLLGNHSLGLLFLHLTLRFGKTTTSSRCKLSLKSACINSTVQSLYNTPYYNTESNITPSCCGAKMILPLNYTKEL